MNGYDPETIHVFRVEYKKLRAFLRMISFERNGQVNISRKIKKIYHLSGAIRDLQLQILRVTEAAEMGSIMPAEYLKLLKKKTRKLESQLTKKYPRKIAAGKVIKEPVHIRKSFTPEMFVSYIKRNTANINAIIIEGNFRDEDIHSIRKILKDTFFNLCVFDNMKRGQLFIVTTVNDEKKSIDKVLHDLGEFQDKCTAIQLLGPYWLKHIDEQEKEILKSIMKQWTDEKSSFKTSLINELKTELPMF
jgi:CHAD domain-containing protein